MWSATDLLLGESPMSCVWNAISSFSCSPRLTNSSHSTWSRTRTESIKEKGQQ